MIAIDSPAANYQWARSFLAPAIRDCSLHPATVVPADGILALLHFARVNRADCKEIHDLHLSITPMTAKANALADGRVVFGCVGRGRIEHDECSHSAINIADAAVQVVPINAVAGENGRLQLSEWGWQSEFPRRFTLSGRFQE